MTGYVYIVEAENGLIKIGQSAVPETRAKQIAACAPIKVRLIAVFDGDAKEEQALHLRFRPYWAWHEWFRCEGEVAKFVEQMRGEGLKAVVDWDDIVDYPPIGFTGTMHSFRATLARKDPTKFIRPPRKVVKQ